jgi:hypothetical protein
MKILEVPQALPHDPQVVVEGVVKAAHRPAQWTSHVQICLSSTAFVQCNQWALKKMSWSLFGSGMASAGTGKIGAETKTALPSEKIFKQGTQGLKYLPCLEFKHH